jgi:hypothetical protein
MYNSYMRGGVLPNLNPEEKKFWEKNANYSVVVTKTQLAKLQDIHYDKVTTRGTMMWLWEYCGIQPHEFLVKRINSYSYEPTIEIRFGGPDIMSIYKLSI